jgi:hypothetical protein
MHMRVLDGLPRYATGVDTDVVALRRVFALQPGSYAPYEVQHRCLFRIGQAEEV